MDSDRMNWHKAEIAIRRFEVVANVNLDALDRHRLKIKSFEKDCDFGSVARERINMERTLQEVIKSLRNISTVCHDLDAGDRQRFNDRIRNVKNRINIIVNEIQESEERQQTQGCDLEQSNDVNYYSSPMALRQDQEQLQDIRFKAQIVQQEAEAHERLAQDICALHEVMGQLSEMVHAQGEVVDSIEANIENAQLNVEAGQRDLRRAQKYKQANYPLAGGLIGAAAAGGPVGLLIGVKIAAVAAIGGAVAGVFGGRYMKSNANRDASPELKEREMDSLSKTA